MDIRDEFFAIFLENLIEDDLSIVNFQTEFRKLESWDSLTAMAIISSLEEKYLVKIDNAAFRTLVTVEDLYRYLLKLIEDHA